jgi:hypothetical protein
MAVAFRGSSQTSFVASGNPPTTITGQQNGDWLIGVAFGGAQFTNSTGWTELNNQQDPNSGTWQYIAAKKVTGTNDGFSPSYTGTSVGLYVFGFSGADSTLGYENFSLIQYAGTTASPATNAITPTLNDSIIFLGYAESSGPQGLSTPDPSTANGFSQILTNSAGQARFVAYDKLLTGQAGVSQGPFTQTWAGVAYGPAFSLVIKPVSAGNTYTMLAAQGSYGLSGQSVGLVYSALGTYTLAVGQGTYVLTGADALVDLSVNLNQGTYTLTGQATGLLFNRLVTFNQGSYTHVGQNVGFIYSGAPVGPGNGGNTKKVAIAMKIGL